MTGKENEMRTTPAIFDEMHMRLANAMNYKRDYLHEKNISIDHSVDDHLSREDLRVKTEYLTMAWCANQISSLKNEHTRKLNN